jgi:RNA polymerase sigma-70 factor (ECF subfamily)
LVCRYRKPIALVILRTAQKWNEGNSATIDDLVQETFLKLCDNNCRLLREFRSDQPEGLTGFLKVVAANLAQDHFKAVHSMKRGGGVVVPAPAKLDIVASTIELTDRAILFSQIDRFLHESCGVRDRDKTVFWLYYREGMTAKAIASISALGLSTKGVETIIHRVTKQVRSRFGLTEIRVRGPQVVEGI